MKLQQARILLEKINALHRSIDLDEGNIAPIERDLMLSYIRQLYDLFLHAQPGESASTAGPVHQDKPVRSAETPARSKRPEPEPLKRSYKPPRIIEIPDLKAASPASENKLSPKNAPATRPLEQEAKKQKPIVEDKPRSIETPPAVAASTEIDALFEQRRATELSEKLGESPVNDLTRAMSINDRLLFMNELFGKNMNHLDETLRQLNRYDGFDEAKSMLYDLAKKHQWTDEEKLDTAKSFIKLVRRRYS